MLSSIEPHRLSLRGGATLSALHSIDPSLACPCRPSCTACPCSSAISCYQFEAVQCCPAIIRTSCRWHRFACTSDTSGYLIPFSRHLTSFYRDWVSYLYFPSDASASCFTHRLPPRAPESESICGLWNHSLCIPVAVQSLRSPSCRLSFAQVWLVLSRSTLSMQ